MTNTIDTVGGLMRCTVPEFKPQDYKGLRSALGKERKSSKHYKCKKPCCLKVKVGKGKDTMLLGVMPLLSALLK